MGNLEPTVLLHRQGIQIYPRSWLIVGVFRSLGETCSGSDELQETLVTLSVQTYSRPSVPNTLDGLTCFFRDR